MDMDHELIEQTKRLNHAAQHDIAALKTLYSNDFLIHRVNDLGETMIFDKQTTIAFFENNYNAGEPHQDDVVEFLHASKSGDVGMVVGKRNMQIGDQLQELLFTQIWRRHAVGWEMIRESIAAKLANSDRALKN
jgi:ketosteroid isomerase-like protein